VREVTIGWIRNTLELSVLALSENLRPAIERNPMLEIVSDAREIEFDSAGNLVPLVADAPGVPRPQSTFPMKTPALQG
jgi:DNA-directed RNA polymerase specialized sigma54-like protein